MPNTNGALFQRFVEQSLNDAIKRAIDDNDICDEDADSCRIAVTAFLSRLAYTIISNGEGTGIKVDKAREILRNANNDDEDALYEKISLNSNLLVKNNTEERFFHQLFQEFFASKYIQDAFEGKKSAAIFFDQTRWWIPNGWEEPAVMLVSILYGDGKQKSWEKINQYLLWLSKTQPELTVRCIERSGIQGLSLGTLDLYTKRQIQKDLIDRINGNKDRFHSKVAIGRALGRFSDIREGVGTVSSLPDIKWINVDNIRASKFPVTVEQFYSFINANDGYDYPDYWIKSNESKIWYENNKEYRTQIWNRDYHKYHSNEPVTNVSYWEAIAFCEWLSRKVGYRITLPSECEWKQIHAFGDKGHSQWECTYSVGLNCGKSDHVSDFGLVWEWCENEFVGLSEVVVTCMLKGGSWRYDSNYQVPEYKMLTYPFLRRNDIGFRVISRNAQS